MHNFFEFMTTTPVSQTDLDYFETIPHLRHYLHDPAYDVTPFVSVFKKPHSPSMDLFFAKTIRSPDTVPHCLMLLKKGGLERQWTLPELTAEKANTKSRPFPAPEIAEVTILFDLREGMNGFANTAHGGSMCALLDETLGMCAEVHRQIQDPEAKTNLYTAQLNTSFLAPVVTPNVVRIKAWLVGAEGRKWRLRAQMDDGHGKPLMETESLWISSREQGSL